MAYTPAEQAATLATLDTTRDADGKPNYAECSRLTGISRGTIRAWDNASAEKLPPEKVIEGARQSLDQMLDTLVRNCVDFENDAIETWRDTPTVELIRAVGTVMGIAADKLLALRGIGQEQGQNVYIGYRVVDSPAQGSGNGARQPEPVHRPGMWAALGQDVPRTDASD